MTEAITGTEIALIVHLPPPPDEVQTDWGTFPITKLTAEQAGWIGEALKLQFIKHVEMACAEKEAAKPAAPSHRPPNDTIANVTDVGQFQAL